MVAVGVRAALQIAMERAPVPTQFPHSNLRTVVGSADPAFQIVKVGMTFEFLGSLSPGPKGMRIGNQIEQFHLPVPWQMNEAGLVPLDTESVDIGEAV